MELIETLLAGKEQGCSDYAAVIEQIPYAKLLGVQMREENGELLFVLPFQEANVGNTQLPALHGGVIGGFLENSALLHLMWARESLEVQNRRFFVGLSAFRPGANLICPV